MLNSLVLITQHKLNASLTTVTKHLLFQIWLDYRFKCIDDPHTNEPLPLSIFFDRNVKKRRLPLAERKLIALVGMNFSFVIFCYEFHRLIVCKGLVLSSEMHFVLDLNAGIQKQYTKFSFCK